MYFCFVTLLKHDLIEERNIFRLKEINQTYLPDWSLTGKFEHIEFV